MKHGDVKNHLADYLEGDLPLGDRALLDAHLDGCDDCAREVDELQRTVGLLRRLPEPEPPPMISANVMRRIRAGETTPSFFERITRSLGAVLEPGFMLPASAIAAAVLVVAIVQEPGLLSSFTELGAGNEPGSPAILAEAGGVPFDSSGSSPSLALGGGDPTGGASIPGERTFLGLRASGLLDPALSDGSTAPTRRMLASAAPSPFSLPFTTVGSSAGGGASVPDARGFAGLEPGASRSTVRYRIQLRSPFLEREFALTPPGFASRAPEPGRLAGGVVDPRTVSVSESLVGTDRGAQRVAQPFRLDAGSSPLSAESSGVEGPDTWLARGMANPSGFAEFLSRKSIAEQELWVSHLAARAEARGLLDELIAGLRESGDPVARVLGDDFAAEADALVARLSSEAGSEAARRIASRARSHRRAAPIPAPSSSSVVRLLVLVA